jgi:hypothetical protein
MLNWKLDLNKNEIPSLWQHSRLQNVPEKRESEDRDRDALRHWVLTPLVTKPPCHVMKNAVIPIFHKIHHLHKQNTHHHKFANFSSITFCRKSSLFYQERSNRFLFRKSVVFCGVLLQYSSSLQMIHYHTTATCVAME